MDEFYGCYEYFDHRNWIQKVSQALEAPIAEECYLAFSEFRTNDYESRSKTKCSDRIFEIQSIAVLMMRQHYWNHFYKRIQHGLV